MNDIAEIDTAPAKALRARGRMLWLPAVLFAAFALIPILAQFGASGFILALLTRTMILALAAMSLDLLIGCGGAYLLSDTAQSPLPIERHNDELIIAGPAQAPDAIDTVLVLTTGS